MSNVLWTNEQQLRANEDGWALILTVDSGKPVHTAYLELFHVGPKFPTRHHAVLHVTEQAKKNSRFHLEALAARSASRIVQQPKPKGKR